MKLTRITALAVALCLLISTNAFATSKPKATPTPPPVRVPVEILDEVPEQIQQVLDIAYNEWSTLNGKNLPKCNKFTEWRGKGVKFGWCGGFITWCMLEAGVPMEVLQKTEEREVEGIVHVKEASVGKLLRGYQRMNRSTNIPQKGFLLVYGKSYNRTIHIALVYDVQDLGNGKYRITTLEGNMSNRVRMYIHDYDISIEKTGNLSAVPKEERTQEETRSFSYKMQEKDWYVNTFLMPWIPSDTMNSWPASDVPMITPPPAL